MVQWVKALGVLENLILFPRIYMMKKKTLAGYLWASTHALTCSCVYMQSSRTNTLQSLIWELFEVT